MDIHDDINAPSAPTDSSLGTNSNINAEQGENITTASRTTTAGSRDVCHHPDLHLPHQNIQPAAQGDLALSAEAHEPWCHVPRASNASAAILTSMPEELLWTIFDECLDDDLWSQIRVQSSHYSYLELPYVVQLSRPLRGTCARWSAAIRHKLFRHSGVRHGILYRVPLIRLVDLQRDFPQLRGVLVACGNPNDFRALEEAMFRLKLLLSPPATGFVGAITWQDTEISGKPYWNSLPLGAVCLEECSALNVPPSAMVASHTVGGLATIQYQLLPWALDFICSELLSLAKYHSLLILELLNLLCRGAHVEIPAFVLCMLSTPREYRPGRLVGRVQRVQLEEDLSLTSCTFRSVMEILCCPYGLHDMFTDRTMPVEFRLFLAPHLPRDNYQGDPGVLRRHFGQIGSQVHHKLADEMGLMWTADVLGSSFFKEVDSYSCISGDTEFNYWNMEWFLHTSGISRMKKLRVIHVDVAASTSFEEIFNTVFLGASKTLTSLTIDAQPMFVREAHHCLYLADPNALPNLTHLDIPMPNICLEAFHPKPRPLLAKSGFWRLRTNSWRCCVDYQAPSDHIHSNLCRSSLFDSPEDFLTLMQAARRMFVDDGWHVEIAVHFDQTGSNSLGPVFDEGLVLEPVSRTVRHCVARCREDVFSRTWSMLTPMFGPAIPEDVLETIVLGAPPAHHKSLRRWFFAYGLERFMIDSSLIPWHALVSTERTDHEMDLQAERLASYGPENYMAYLQAEMNLAFDTAPEDDIVSDSETEVE